MTVNVTYQRDFVALLKQGTWVTYQRYYVPYIEAKGSSISYDRLFVPFVLDTTPTVGRRRNFMFFQS